MSIEAIREKLAGGCKRHGRHDCAMCPLPIFHADEVREVVARCAELEAVGRAVINAVEWLPDEDFDDGKNEIGIMVWRSDIGELARLANRLRALGLTADGNDRATAELALPSQPE